jgi:Zn-dependent protease
VLDISPAHDPDCHGSDRAHLRPHMKWAWKLGRLAGIDTYVHATFLLLVGWAAWASYAGAGSALAVVLGLTFLFAVFGSVLLHELGHALMARRYGIETRKIILSPIGGLAQLEGMPSNPRQELLVALAGPAVNFVLAAILWMVGHGTSVVATYGLIEGLMWANLTLGLFNLVPAFPMDGGRALRAFLATRMGNHTATEVAVGIGKVVAVAMGVVGFFTSWVLVAIAVFVWFAAQSELKAAREERAWDLLEQGDAWWDRDPTQPRIDWRQRIPRWFASAPGFLRDVWPLGRTERPAARGIRVVIVAAPVPPSR